MNAYRKQQLRAAELIEQGATAEQIAAVYGWIRGEPEQSAQTEHNQTLTEPRKCGIIKAIRRHVRRWKRKQEGKTMKKLYIESDNGGRSVMLRIGSKWYVCDCAPSGCFGDVDILEGTEEEAAARMRAAINAGEIYDENDCAENLDTFRYIPDYDGLTTEQIENRENDGRTCDYMRMVEI
jgi:hypothetical protein